MDGFRSLPEWISTTAIPEFVGPKMTISTLCVVSKAWRCMLLACGSLGEMLVSAKARGMHIHVNLLEELPFPLLKYIVNGPLRDESLRSFHVCGSGICCESGIAGRARAEPLRVGPWEVRSRMLIFDPTRECWTAGFSSFELVMTAEQHPDEDLELHKFTSRTGGDPEREEAIQPDPERVWEIISSRSVLALPRGTGLMMAVCNDITAFQGEMILASAIGATRIFGLPKNKDVKPFFIDADGEPINSSFQVVSCLQRCCYREAAFSTNLLHKVFSCDYGAEEITEYP